jgi:N-acetylneuraminic acid mutarotase
VSTTIRAHFLAENPSTDEWEVTFSMEFLDKAGKVIEKVTKKSSWEGEAKPFDFDHEILEYVVPMIAQVRVKLEGRLD